MPSPAAASAPAAALAGDHGSTRPQPRNDQPASPCGSGSAGSRKRRRISLASLSPYATLPWKRAWLVGASSRCGCGDLVPASLVLPAAFVGAEGVDDGVPADSGQTGFLCPAWGGLGNWLRPEATEGRQCSSRGRPADQGDLSSEISLAALAHCFNTASNSVNERGALVPTRGAS